MDKSECNSLDFPVLLCGFADVLTGLVQGVETTEDYERRKHFTSEQYTGILKDRPTYSRSGACRRRGCGCVTHICPKLSIILKASRQLRALRSMRIGYRSSFIGNSGVFIKFMLLHPPLTDNSARHCSK